MNPGEARERLCQPHLPDARSRRITSGSVQQALELAIATEPLEKKIRVEGDQDRLITALDLPGQVREALRGRPHQRGRGFAASRLRPQGTWTSSTSTISSPRELVAGSPYGSSSTAAVSRSRSVAKGRSPFPRRTEKGKVTVPCLLRLPWIPGRGTSRYEVDERLPRPCAMIGAEEIAAGRDVEDAEHTPPTVAWIRPTAPGRDAQGRR